MREKVILPELNEIKVFNRMKPTVPPEWYQHFEINPHFVSPMASFGEGYRYNITGLTHDPLGFPTSKPEEIEAKLNKLEKKITSNVNDIVRVDEEFMEDATIAVFAVRDRCPRCQAGYQDGTAQKDQGWLDPAPDHLALPGYLYGADVRAVRDDNRGGAEPGTVAGRGHAH